MNARQYETLGDLEFATDNLAKFGVRYARPLDCGGSNGSHHGATLRWLADNGYAEQRSYFVGSRHVNKYRITDKGREYLTNNKRPPC